MPKKKAAESSSDSDSGPDDRTPAKKPKTNDDGNFEIELGRNRRVTVSSFRGKVYVNIREYFEKDGKLAPTKKGISLTPDQFKMIMDNADDINDAIKKQ